MATPSSPLDQLMSSAPVPASLSGLSPLDQLLASPPAAQPAASAQDEASNTRQMLVSGLTGMPTPNMTDADKASFAKGKAAGAVSVPLVAGAAVAGSSGALAPIAQRFGIKALEAGGLGAGYDLYKELKKVFEGKNK
jgi:hypothetical protein